MADFFISTTAIDIDILLGEHQEARLTKFTELLKQVEAALIAKFKDDLITGGGGGMIELTKLKVLAVDVNVAHKKGKLVLTYLVNRFFACEGEEVNKMQKETLNWTLDTANNQLTLSVFELPES